MQMRLRPQSSFILSSVRHVASSANNARDKATFCEHIYFARFCVSTKITDVLPA